MTKAFLTKLPGDFFESSVGKDTYASIATASKDKLVSELSEKIGHLEKKNTEKDMKIEALEDSIRNNHDDSFTNQEIMQLKQGFTEILKELEKKGPAN